VQVTQHGESFFFFTTHVRATILFDSDCELEHEGTSKSS